MTDQIKNWLCFNDDDIISYLNAIDKYPGLCKFVSTEFIEGFCKMEYVKQFDYLNRDSYNTSYFKKSEKERKEIMNNDWKVIYKKLKKHTK